MRSRQGSLVVSGFGVSGKDGSRIVAERAQRRAAFRTARRSSARCRTSFATEPYVVLNLNTPDFTTAARLAEGINKLLGDGHGAQRWMRFR